MNAGFTGRNLIREVFIMEMYTSASGKSYKIPKPNMTTEEFDKWTKKVEAVEFLFNSPKLPAEYADPNYDPDYKLLREAAFRERGLIPTL
jgi:hypothetical protein